MFFSALHLIYMLIPLAVTGILFLIFRTRSQNTKRTVVLAVSLLNTLQHILKPYIYPQYGGMSIGAPSTAYNMCALLILIAPIVLLVGSELWQNFMFYIGSIAGYSSILVTYWLDSPMEEQVRFVICHGLLFVSSFLPLLFGIYKVNYRKCWRLPFVFYTCLMIQIITNMINFQLGIVGDVGDITMYEYIVRENPCWAMCPPQDYGFILDLVSPLTPSVFLDNGSGYTPILWYGVPMFILITAVGFLLGMLLKVSNNCM